MEINNQTVIELAKDLEFDLIGFAKADALNEEIVHLNEWIGRNYQASMKYMEKNIEKRADVRKILPGAASVISLGMNYYKDEELYAEKGIGKVSRYAWGRDYHYVIWEKLDEFVEELKMIDPEFEAKTYVDTGPVMDKTWAVKSGIGWLGKHTNVINREMGSWFFIANIITNFEFEYDQPIADFCGACTACIDACPTKAIVDEYVVDSNKCISFLTIENKEDKIPSKFENQFNDWIFGCDICQDVCPWNNKFSKPTSVKDFEPKNKIIDFEDIFTMTNRSFKEVFSDSPLSRAKLKGMKRNAEFLKRETSGFAKTTTPRQGRSGK